MTKVPTYEHLRPSALTNAAVLEKARATSRVLLLLLLLLDFFVSFQFFPLFVSSISVYPQALCGRGIRTGRGVSSSSTLFSEYTGLV